MTAPAPDRRGLRCPQCHFALTGLTSARCPECGAGLPRDHVLEADRALGLFAREQRWRTWVVWLACCLWIGVHIATIDARIGLVLAWSPAVVITVLLITPALSTRLIGQDTLRRAIRAVSYRSSYWAALPWIMLAPAVWSGGGGEVGGALCLWLVAIPLGVIMLIGSRARLIRSIPLEWFDRDSYNLVLTTNQAVAIGAWCVLTYTAVQTAAHYTP